MNFCLKKSWAVGVILKVINAVEVAKKKCQSRLTYFGEISCCVVSISFRPILEGVNFDICLVVRVGVESSVSIVPVV